MRQVVVLLSHQHIADQQDVKIKLFPEAFLLHPQKNLREQYRKESNPLLTF
jgi:hypothetical protein